MEELNFTTFWPEPNRDSFEAHIESNA